jgi:glycosyltransferase involved in cell wall biosynthesis
MRVAVVTPVLNGERFLRETLESVLAQEGPAIELLVVDGGSTDDTLAILRAYGDRVRWISGKDRGQADAINKGVALTGGDVVAYLNADDVWLPGAVARAVEAFAADPGVDVVYGAAQFVDADGRTIAPYPTQPLTRPNLERACPVCQPASFVRRTAWERAGGLATGHDYAFDYDLWARLEAAGARAVMLEEIVATSRLHDQAKSLAARPAAYREAVEVAQRYFGYVAPTWAWGMACAQTGRGDGVLTPSGGGMREAALALAIGLRHNPRQPRRFLRESIALGRTHAIRR